MSYWNGKRYLRSAECHVFNVTSAKRNSGKILVPSLLKHSFNLSRHFETLKFAFYGIISDILVAIL